MNKLFTILAILFFSFSCSKNLPEDTEHIVGEWNLVSTSGTIHGGGIDLQYETLVIDNEMNFKCLTSGDVIASGKLVESNNNEFDYFIELNFDVNNYSGYFELAEDNEKGVTFIDDKMNFMAPCCDRVNSHFEKQ